MDNPIIYIVSGIILLGFAYSFIAPIISHFQKQSLLKKIADRAGCQFSNGKITSTRGNMKFSYMPWTKSKISNRNFHSLKLTDESSEFQDFSIDTHDSENPGEIVTEPLDGELAEQLKKFISSDDSAIYITTSKGGEIEISSGNPLTSLLAHFNGTESSNKTISMQIKRLKKNKGLPGIIGEWGYKDSLSEEEYITRLADTIKTGFDLLEKTAKIVSKKPTTL